MRPEWKSTMAFSSSLAGIHDEGAGAGDRLVDRRAAHDEDQRVRGGFHLATSLPARSSTSSSPAAADLAVHGDPSPSTTYNPAEKPWRSARSASRPAGMRSSSRSTGVKVLSRAFRAAVFAGDDAHRCAAGEVHRELVRGDHMVAGRGHLPSPAGRPGAAGCGSAPAQGEAAGCGIPCGGGRTRGHPLHVAGPMRPHGRRCPDARRRPREPGVTVSKPR